MQMEIQAIVIAYDATLDGFGNNVAFVSEADNLDSRMTDSNGVPDIFVRTYRDFDGDDF